MIFFAEAFQYFANFKFLPFPYQIFEVVFFNEHLPMVVSANTCLKVT